VRRGNALIIITKTILYGDPVKGYPTLMVAVLFLGGVQLLFIGVVCEYRGRVVNEVKARPLYFVNAYEPSALARSIAAAKGPDGVAQDSVNERLSGG
jgi:polyisoprenyl-phosphate glycosyltransferase